MKHTLAFTAIGLAIVAPAFVAFPGDDVARNAEPASLWNEDDERIFLLLKENEPRVLKSYIDILALSSMAEKRLLALEALAYDRIFPDAPDVFGADYRVEHLVRLLADNSPKVRHTAAAVLHALLPSETVVIVPRLQRLQDQVPQSSPVRKELNLILDELAKRLKPAASPKEK